MRLLPSLSAAAVLHAALIGLAPRGDGRAHVEGRAPTPVEIREAAAKHEPAPPPPAPLPDVASPTTGLAARRAGRADPRVAPAHREDTAPPSLARPNRDPASAPGTTPIAMAAPDTARPSPSAATVGAGGAAIAESARTGGSGIGAAGPGEGGGGGDTRLGGGGGGGDVRRTIVARIRANRRYPALARRRGVEGTVGLSLAVRPDGSIDVEVVRSADPLLDEAAREAARAAAPLPPAAGRFEIDLAFHLTDE